MDTASSRKGDQRFWLSHEQQESIRKRFPKDVELSLETYLPGKVHADIYEVLPVGKQSFLWFTFFGDSHSAFVVSSTQRGFRFDRVCACFADELAYGTILSGVFTIRSKEDGTPHSFFCADDVVYYKGTRMRGRTIGSRMSIVSRMFNEHEIGNIGPTDGVITICAPMMTSDFTVAQGYVNSFPYPTYGIKMVNIDENKPLGIMPSKGIVSSDSRCVFIVRANTDPDSYTLFGVEHDDSSSMKNNSRLKEVGLALVPTYADSVRMNLLFRNIRENISIDYIEESDDEDDFQNIDPAKFLLDGAEHKMSCSFSKTCNRWVPESIANDDARVSAVPNMSNPKPKHNGNVSSQRHKRDWGGAGGWDRDRKPNASFRKVMYKPASKGVGTGNRDFRNSPQTNVVRKPIFSVYGR